MNRGLDVDDLIEEWGKSMEHAKVTVFENGKILEIDHNFNPAIVKDKTKETGGRVSEPSLIDITNDDELMDRVLKKSAEMQDKTLKKAEDEE